jgi:hypothetical protein
MEETAAEAADAAAKEEGGSTGAEGKETAVGS